MSKWIKIFCTILVIVAIGFRMFVYYDPDNGCTIKVLPSFQPSNWDFRQVLKLLKTTSRQDYEYLCTNVETINKDIACGGFDGGCYYTDRSKTLYIGNDQDNMAVTMAVIVHELCHARQYNEGRVLAEYECYAKGVEYLTNLYAY